MGKLDGGAKQTARRTVEASAAGDVVIAATWRPPRLGAPSRGSAAAPTARRSTAPGSRALLRRQVRQVERVEERSPPWMGEEPLWVVAPHMPSWLHTVRAPKRFAPGCYRLGPSPFQFLWIAANELPLRDELVPFLTARSGKALDEFARWVAPRRDVEWVISMLEYLPMSPKTREDLLRRFARVDDPEIEARRQWILQALLAHTPEVSEQLIEQGIEKGIEKGQLTEARALLRRVLARRGFAPTAAMETQIDACSELGTLHRWLDQAMTAASAEEALA